MLVTVFFRERSQYGKSTSENEANVKRVTNECYEEIGLSVPANTAPSTPHPSQYLPAEGDYEIA